MELEDYITHEIRKKLERDDLSDYDAGYLAALEDIQQIYFPSK